MPNWSQAVFDPVRARGGVSGNEYVDKIFDSAARRDAGSKYASGDYKGASAALAKRGDFAGAGAIQNTQMQRAQAQHEFIRKAAPVFQAALATDGPEGVLRAYQMIGPDLESLGVPPEQIASDMQRFQQDPQGAVAMLTSFAQADLEFRSVGDDVVVLDKSTGKEVSRIKGEPTLRDRQAQANADRTFSAGREDRAIAQQNLEAARADTAAYRNATLAQGDSRIAASGAASQGSGLTRLQVGRAKEKMASLKAIENQLTRVEETMAGAETGGYTGYLAGRVPGGLDPESDTFDKSVALLAALSRQLTRTPGEGAMSDYETRLAQLVLLTRTDTPEGRRESIAGIRELIGSIRSGYSELLGEPAGAGAGQPNPPPPNGGAPGPGNRIRYDAQGNRIP